MEKQNKSVVVTFRVTPTQFRRLKEYAKYQSATVSKVIQSRIAEITA
jgi:NRPS condensation-like uncharacterized protein